MSKFYYNVLQSFESDVSQTVKSRVLKYLGALIFTATWAIPLVKGEDSFKYVVGLCTLLSVGMILTNLYKGKIKLSRYRLTYLIPIEILGISFLINGIYFRVLGYMVIGIVFSLILPLFHMVIADKDRSKWMEAISNGIILSFIIYALLSFISGPALDLSQYASVSSNPNALGGFTIVVVSACLFLIFQRTERGLKQDRRFCIYQSTS